MTRHLLLAISLAACGKASATDSKPPPPFTGTLTIERVMSKNASNTDVCRDPWDIELARLEARLGPPTKIDGDDFHWAAREGTRCAYFTVQRGECPSSWGKPGPHLYISTDSVTTVQGGENPYGSFEYCVDFLPKG
jgi:hypothetical protein